MAKIRRATPKQKILAQAGQQALDHFKALLQRADQTIQDLVVHSPEDLRDQLLHKSLTAKGDLKDRKALNAMERRQKYQGPTEPHQVIPKEKIPRILANLPMRAGTMELEGKKITGEGPARKVWIATHRITNYGPVNQEKLTNILQGKERQGIVGTRHPATDEVHLSAGHEQVLAAKLAGIPAVQIHLSQPKEVTEEPVLGADPLTVEMLGKEVLRGQTYDLPSYLEPMAEVARNLSWEDLLTVNEGKKTPEEKAAEEKSIQAEHLRTMAWMTLYGQLKDPEKTNQRIEQDPAYREAEKRVAAAKEEEKRTAKEWLNKRALWANGKRESAKLREEDGAPKGGWTLQALWDEVHKVPVN